MNDDMQKILPLETKDIDEITDLDYKKIKDTVLIFASEDERLKFLGEILSNESSRSILTILIEKEMTLMQIAKQTGLNPTLIIHHLKKMLQSDIVTITKNTVNKKGRPMKFYRAMPILMISSKNTCDDIYKDKSLLSAIKKISRFTAIGLAGMSAWMMTRANTMLDPIQSAYKYPRPTLPPYMTPIEPNSAIFLQGDLIIPAISAGIVVIAGLVANYIISKHRKKP